VLIKKLQCLAEKQASPIKNPLKPTASIIPFLLKNAPFRQNIFVDKI